MKRQDVIWRLRKPKQKQFGFRRISLGNQKCRIALEGAKLKNIFAKMRTEEEEFYPTKYFAVNVHQI